jgi:DNA polymerase-1
MEHNGVKIDAEKLKSLCKEVDIKIENLKKAIFKITGKEFNLNSPKH